MHEDEEDVDIQSEMEDGYVISDRRRGGYSVSEGGEHLDDFLEWDDAITFIADSMEHDKFWPNVFYVNDHGNVDLLALKYKTRKGRVVGKVIDKIVRSYV